MKMEFDEFAPLFGPWADIFRPFIESEDMFNIYQKIKDEVFNKKRIVVPKYDNVFKVFQKSSPHNVKSVWYLMDPYPRRYKDKNNQATGIAMDCSNSPDDTIQPSLETFYQSVDKYLGRRVEHRKSLQYLLDQGILLLNTDLTVRLNATGSHKGLWEKFQKFFLEQVMWSKPGIVYILSGEVSNSMEKYINPLGNHILKIEHPSFAARQQRDWNNKNLFKTMDTLSGKTYWDPAEYDKISKPPF